ncbi:MAG TPA: molybdopterin-binding protein [Aquabacterium sp.]|nr:molybdopterin-binding protein [Aquabacterium sp.]
MAFGVIIIGDEILSGRRQDKHLTQAIEQLSKRGLTLSWARYVGDDPQRIEAELRSALAGDDVVFSFGGIGATPDDHTRACAAAALEQQLVLHPEARELILGRSREMAEQEGRVFVESDPDVQRRLEMGCFPQGAEIIPNPYNRIPGFSIGRRVHFLPGFPVMAWPMMEWVLDHWHAGLHGVIRMQEKSVIVLDGLESHLTPLMMDIEARFPGIKVFSLPSVDHPQWGRHIDLGVKGTGPLLDSAFEALQSGLTKLGAKTGPTMVR